MTEHDPIKAAAEELAGLEDTWKVLNTMARAAERKLGEAEAAMNALVKARSVVGVIRDTQQAKLRALRAAAERETAS